MAQDYAGSLIAVSVCFLVINTLFIIGRLVSRRLLKDVEWCLDEVFAICGYVFCTGMCAVGLCFVRYANEGYPVLEALQRNPEAMVNWAKLILVLEVVYTSATSLTKLSMLFLFHRVFGPRPYRIATISLMTLVVLSWLGTMLAGILACIPVEKFWNQGSTGQCFNTEAYYRWGPLPGVVLDLLILVLPMVGVWRLEASRGRKIGLTCTFIVGSLGMIACIARNVLFWQHAVYIDPTLAWYLVGISIIEPSFYLLACCLVAMKPLAHYAAGRWRGGMLGSGHQGVCKGDSSDGESGMTPTSPLVGIKQCSARRHARPALYASLDT